MISIPLGKALVPVRVEKKFDTDMVMLQYEKERCGGCVFRGTPDCIHFECLKDDVRVIYVIKEFI